MTLRVRRAGTNVSVWLDDAQVLQGDDGGSGRHGKLGLIVSATDRTSGAGAQYSLLRLDTASVAPGCTPQCSNRVCGDDGCGGACGSRGQGRTCSPAGACVGGAPAGSWLSGVASEAKVNGPFAQWRGGPWRSAGPGTTPPSSA